MPKTTSCLAPCEISEEREKLNYGPRTQAYTKKKKKFWTEPRPCMVLGLKPMGKPSTQKIFGQNQGLAWSSDSSLWGNQVLKKSFGHNQGLAWSSDSSLCGNQVLKKVLDRTKALHGPRTQAYGETKYEKGKKSQVLDITKTLRGPRTQAYGETNYPDGKVLGSNTVKC